MEVHDGDLYSMSDVSSSTIPRNSQQDKETVAFRFGDREYNIFGEALIGDEEAA
jgi:hypothetical protein